MKPMTHTTPTSAPSPGRVAALRAAGLGLAASASIGLGLALAGPAAADPPREPLLLQCDVLGPLTISVPADAPWTPGLVVGSNQVGHPYSFTFTVTFTPTGGVPQTTVDHYSKPAPAHDRHDRCTFHQEGGDDSGTFTLDGEALIAYTPR
ncbi:hypothetical protein [Pedococcus bigeumensis]|uniref:hypothetical protein n=1 Tax=Pedococcus bigeumensis TaxID=433644 RepID=UPI002FEAB4B5